MLAEITQVMPNIGDAGGWALCVIVIGMLIKVWPVIQLQTIKAREALRGEQRGTIERCEAEIIDLRKAVHKAEEHIHQLDLKLVGTVAAYRILYNAEALRDSESPALHQAQLVFKTVWDGPMPASGHQ
jgi:hypothetical protein